eukprot:TRINITY_DN61501_c0_g1_i1.p1 TRINITY_DN61501_c0_g1~~TRINITY_DN61501_c0_g1_i1.p1  ORF type:complete len:239 (+),score=43.10 TRINITY_DN61501_c0_g1_i1:311-1027(+)
MAGRQPRFDVGVARNAATPSSMKSGTLSMPELAALVQEEEAAENAVREMMKTAFSRRDVDGIQKATKLASEAGMYRRVGEADKLMMRLEAQQMLASAIHRRHSGRLRDAIDKAEGCGLESRDLESARTLLMHDECHLQLSSAIREGDGHKLRDVISKAQALGASRDDPILRQAARALGQLRKREEFNATFSRSPKNSPLAACGRRQLASVERRRLSSGELAPGTSCSDESLKRSYSRG